MPLDRAQQNDELKADFKQNIFAASPKNSTSIRKQLYKISGLGVKNRIFVKTNEINAVHENRHNFGYGVAMKLSFRN